MSSSKFPAVSGCSGVREPKPLPRPAPFIPPREACYVGVSQEHSTPMAARKERSLEALCFLTPQQRGERQTHRGGAAPPKHTAYYTLLNGGRQSYCMQMKQGSRVYGIQWIRKAGLANLGRNCLRRVHSIGGNYSEEESCGGHFLHPLLEFPF